MGSEISNQKDKQTEPFLPIWIILLVIGIISIVVVLTYFYFTSKNDGIPADRIISKHALEKSDWLAFWGCLLGVVSTIMFSILSWKQNKTLEKINSDYKAREFKLSTMRYVSECYSQLSLYRVAFFITGNNKEAIMLEFEDKGKITPNELIFKYLDFYWIEENKKINAFSIQDRSIDVMNRDASQQSKVDFSVSFEINKDKDKYLEMYAKIKQTNQKNQPALFVSLGCDINNLMKVTTRIEGDIPLGPGNIYLPDDQDKEKILFVAFDSHIRAISYELTGDID